METVKDHRSITVHLVNHGILTGLRWNIRTIHGVYGDPTHLEQLKRKENNYDYHYLWKL